MIMIQLGLVECVECLEGDGERDMECAEECAEGTSLRLTIA